MALWPGKKDEDAQADDRGGAGSDPLYTLVERLGELGGLLEQTNRQVVQYLVARQSSADCPEKSALLVKLDTLIEKVDRPAAAAPQADAPSGTSAATEPGEEALRTTSGPLQQKLTDLETAIQSLGRKTADDDPPDSLGRALARLQEDNGQHHAALSDAIGQLRQRLEAGLQDVADRLREEEADEADAGPNDHGDWQRAILGAELAENPRLEAQRRRLLEGALAGDPDACSLVGQLLVFRSAAADRLPPLLKDLGEAYYRWQPRTSAATDPMEEALLDWLRHALQEAGISNSIETVHPGERFDAARHTAATRGVEITEVRGWIVLRDNGRVYTKANVAAR